MPDGWEASHNLSPVSSTGWDGPSGDPDDDGLANITEFRVGTDPRIPDTDSDGMPDGWEVPWGLDPTDPSGRNGPHGDEDDDQFTNLEEYQAGTYPFDSDTDDDSMPDGWESRSGISPVSSEGPDGPSGDPDDDGLTNVDEFNRGTHPRNSDSDSDGMPDGWEVAWALDPTSAAGPDGPHADNDGDGLNNLGEYKAQTDLNDDDTDDDGMPDGWEYAHGISPVSPEGADGPAGDPDRDGLSNIEELALGTNPGNPDTDGDGMPDALEVEWGFDPTGTTGPDGPHGDVDGDGLTNLSEYQTGTNLFDGDSDGDGINDGDEVFAGTSPLDPSSLFRTLAIEAVEGERAVRIAFTSVPGRSYRLLYSPDMEHWKPSSGVVIATCFVSTLQIPSFFNREFFRVEVLP